jgi:GNAT superfamily N-acetyltransferase
MESINISFEFLQPKHLSELVTMYQSIFNKKVDESYFEIKYGLHLSNQKQMSVVGLHYGEVIGFFGVLTHTFELEDQSFSMLFTCDYFLKESYRGKGVFDRIYAFVKEQAIAQNHYYLYTFDSAQTHKFGQKMGWSKIPSFVGVEWITFPKTIKSIQERTLGAGWSENRLEKLLSSYKTELTSEHLPKISMFYDESFLKMKRYGKRFFIELNGCFVWLKYDYRLTIGSIKITKDGDLKGMLKNLKSIAKKSGVHQIVMHLRPEDPLLDRISNLGSTFDSYNASFLTLKEDLPQFERFTIHFVQGDMF